MKTPPGDRRRLGCAIGAAMAALALLLGAGYQFKNYQVMMEGRPEKAAPILIAITDPLTGAVVPAGAPLLVHVDANAAAALLSLELWVNGQIAGIQAAPGSQGITPFSASFAWTPAEPGTYTLIARALQAEQQSADSAPVIVIVGPTEKLSDEGGGDGGQNIPISNGGGWNGDSNPLPPPPAPPAEQDSLGPGQPWNLSLGDWLTGDLGGPPQAPELTAEAEGCGALLNIHDLSQNEDGFILFRMTDTNPALTKIATLEGQSELEWLTFTDTSYTHANSYLVRAFNGTQVTDSNIAFAAGDPGNCAQAATPPLISIKLTSLQTDIDAEMVYCYKSLNGGDWSRWPLTGFFTPGEDGFDVGSQADVILLNELGGKTLTLDLECWGWVGGALQLLGKLHHNGFDPGLLGATQLSDGGLLLDMEMGEGLKTLGHDTYPVITDPKMPKVLALIGFGPEACKEHLPGKGDNFLENLLFCSWYPEYNEDQGQSQPYLVWYVLNGSCENGTDCHSLQHYVARAKLFGGQVGFQVFSYEQDGDSSLQVHFPTEITPYDRTQHVMMPPEVCNGNQNQYIVRMFYDGGPNDPEYTNLKVESLDSNIVGSIFNCPPPSEVKLDVIFDTLKIADADDGDISTTTLEVYASMTAHGQNPGTGSALNLGEWGESAMECFDFGFSAGFCPNIMWSGDFPFAEMKLCASDSYKHCLGDYAQGNNKIQITVGEGSQVRIALHAMDYDNASADDKLCHTEKYFGPMSIFGWMDFSVSSSMASGDYGSGSCTVFFHIQPAQ